MSFEEVTSHVPHCDGCGPACWDESEDGPPHFVGANVAAAQVLADKFGWTIEKLASGTILMLCARCARERECEQAGHQWYTPVLLAPMPDGLRIPELCSHCSRTRRDYDPLDTPPAGHPDAEPVVLSDADLTLLAAYDAELTEARKEN